ncbi:hypothetical protein PAMA_019408 [Pampus argenteus]
MPKDWSHSRSEMLDVAKICFPTDQSSKSFTGRGMRMHRCNENYKGSRCEQFQLFSSSTNAGEAGLIAAVVTVALLILVVLAVVIYYIRKVLKAKQQSQGSSQQEYWKVKPRV